LVIGRPNPLNQEKAHNGSIVTTFAHWLIAKAVVFPKIVPRDAGLP